MLKQRVITALALGPLVILSIFSLNVISYSVLIGAILLLGATEWFALVPTSSKNVRVTASILLIILFGVLYCCAQSELVMWFCLAVWLFYFAMIMLYPSSQPLWGRTYLMLAGLFIIMGGCFEAMHSIRTSSHGMGLIFYLFLLIWGADSGAYFGGKALGKYKLIPRVSPGKTIEGAVCALLTTLLVALIAAYFFDASPSVRWFGVAVITLIASIFGDLLISMFKRRVNLKDTGSLLPGHGGVLDRIDSLLCASFFFYISARLLGVIQLAGA